MFKIAILGGGISGVFAGIRIKENHPSYEVSIFEHNDKLLKKIYATGNGKCNFANIGSLKDKYHNEEFALNIIKEFDAQSIINYFDSIGVKSKSIGDLIYPYSESAETVAHKLLERVNELKISVHLSINVKDYNNGLILTDRGTFSYDALIISIGGKSSPKLGSNGLFWPILIKHGYKMRETSPSLCPIKTKENTKMVEGLRSKVKASLYQNNKLIHVEDGELLFKKDGLSGMVIFNMTHYINRLDNKNNLSIHLDFAPNMKGDYDSLVNPKIAKYLLDNKLDIHKTIFTFKGFYDYENSQITSGGIKLENLNDDLSSKLEPNVYFIGEVVDIDAICGGYNMMWAFASAERVNNSLIIKDDINTPTSEFSKKAPWEK